MTKNKNKNRENGNSIQKSSSNFTEMLVSGNYRQARSIAKTVLADPTSSESSRAAAQEVISSMRYDRAALIAGLALLGVLLTIIGLLYN